MSTAILTLSSLDACKRPLQAWGMKTGRRIRERRDHVGLTQEQLAEPFKLTRESIANWERDANLPRGKRLVKLAGLLRCDVDYLLGKQETPMAIKDDDAYIAKMLAVPPRARRTLERVADALLEDTAEPQHPRGSPKKGR